MTYRIWVDQDNVIYDLSIWYDLHNADYPDHILLEKDITGWDTQAICNGVGCTANVYSYFDDPKTWIDGKPIENSQDITRQWLKDLDVDLGILTTAANGMSMPLKVIWLKENFRHIKDLVIVNGHLKHLLRGDILIDDGPHNLEHWQGIAILFNKPWNQHVSRLRANNWNEVDSLVRRSITFLDAGYEHKWIENVLYSEQRINK